MSEMDMSHHSQIAQAFDNIIPLQFFFLTFQVVWHQYRTLLMCIWMAEMHGKLLSSLSATNNKSSLIMVST